MEANELELNKRRNLMEDIFNRCEEVMVDFKWEILSDEVVDTINNKFNSICEYYSDKFTKFIFIPLHKEDLLKGNAKLRNQIKINYHSIDKAEWVEGASITTWLNVL